ncbi:hypothetical protein [Isosphaera pallida]|uniref:hypothetical protein n=1 Tax=Isosphaera pallida TaxID=128 RepID=UPI0003030796|nr:hypothetical protein [Isosphaera pallida]
MRWFLSLFVLVMGLSLTGCNQSADTPPAPGVKVDPIQPDNTPKDVRKGGPPTGSSSGMNFNPGADN